MIAPTHIAFGTLTAFLIGATPQQAILAAIGSLLPDIDTPQPHRTHFSLFLVDRIQIWTPWIFSFPVGFPYFY